jgi:hypothetical protein
LRASSRLAQGDLKGVMVGVAFIQIVTIAAKQTAKGLADSDGSSSASRVKETGLSIGPASGGSRHNLARLAQALAKGRIGSIVIGIENQMVAEGSYITHRQQRIRLKLPLNREIQMLGVGGGRIAQRVNIP